jgi:hypothetical protein
MRYGETTVEVSVVAALPTRRAPGRQPIPWARPTPSPCPKAPPTSLWTLPRHTAAPSRPPAGCIAGAWPLSTPVPLSTPKVSRNTKIDVNFCWN